MLSVVLFSEAAAAAAAVRAALGVLPGRRACGLFTRSRPAELAGSAMCTLGFPPLGQGACYQLLVRIMQTTFFYFSWLLLLHARMSTSTGPQRIPDTQSSLLILCFLISGSKQPALESCHRRLTVRGLNRGGHRFRKIGVWG